MKLDLNGAVSTLKSLIGIAALIMITIGVLRAFGISVPYVRISGTELAALAAAAAYIAR